MENFDEELMREIDRFVAAVNDNFDPNKPFPENPYTSEQIGQYNQWAQQITLNKVFGAESDTLNKYRL